MLASVLGATSAKAEDAKPADANAYGLSLTDASMEAGGQYFFSKPGTSPSNSAAKFNEYGTQTNSAFLRSFNFNLENKDSSIVADVYGKNLFTNDQAIEADISQPGVQSLTLGWYQSPQLRSNTAQSIFGGVGSTNLTVAPGVVTSLYNGIFNSTNGNYATGPGNNSTVPVTFQLPGGTTKQPFGCYLPGQTGTLACGAGITPVATTIANNTSRINLGLQRDRREINYLWHPTPNWDVKVEYSNEHRWGTQEQGFLFSSSTSTPMAAVPAPVDDVTQNASISGEYHGLSPWGMNWNALLKYQTSIYTDSFNSFTAENPFGGPGSPAGGGVSHCPVASAATTANCYGWGQMSTAPSNASNTVVAMLGADLPWFKSSRYMGTFEYNRMTQNEAFLAPTINPNLAPAALSRGSLYGNIDTMLFNNVLTSQITSDLKNKLTYRYYSDINNTPALTLTNWVLNDAAMATNYAPHTTLFTSYKKQNASDEVSWRPTKWATVGASGGWEQYTYSETGTNQTNEFTGKVFANLNPTDWMTVRVDDAFSKRRYNNYNWQAFVGNVMGTPSLTENPALVDFNVANRDRNVGKLYVDFITPIQGLTITPTAGFRWDDYPNDPNLTRQGLNQIGLRADHDWNAGIEVDYSLNSTSSFSLSYNFEKSRQLLVGDQASTLAAANSAMYQSDMGETIHTWTAAANYMVIPDKLNLKLGLSYEKADSAWNTGPLAGCTGNNCGVITAGANPAYPPESSRFWHADVTATYKVDPTYLGSFGSKGEAYLNLHYMWERNSVTNWQNAGSSYMYLPQNSSTVSFKDMIFMSGNNPNYNAQAIMASLVVKW